MNEKVLVDESTVKDAMHAIYKLQSSLGIDLSDEDGYGHIYFALEQALEVSE
jgi:hypothetical protein